MKQLILLCLFIVSILLVACDKKDSLPPLTDKEMLVGHWERDYFRWEVYDKNGAFSYEGGPFDTEFTMIYTEGEYTLSSLGHIERGTYDFIVDQDTRYLQLEAVTDILSRTYYIDSISRSNLDIHYRIDKYIWDWRTYL
ncbi:hypothetical protein H8S95_07685 [Pontibacter sp. KCTC 32443]|uniref:hypothetical protein n=1 Tax=Pontibacter TaxID=323449 RepID=UPI00164D96EB|nr:MULTISPECIES: hypothetical protein [Pontibacter]MBC5773940.1 hypothetical protein [Pontibacter sp. KCTC 32443]